MKDVVSLGIMQDYGKSSASLFYKEFLDDVESIKNIYLVYSKYSYLFRQCSLIKDDLRDNIKNNANLNEEQKEQIFNLLDSFDSSFKSREELKNERDTFLKQNAPDKRMYG